MTATADGQPKSEGRDGLRESAWKGPPVRTRVGPVDWAPSLDHTLAILDPTRRARGQLIGVRLNASKTVTSRKGCSSKRPVERGRSGAGLSNRRLVSFDARGVTFRTRGSNVADTQPADREAFEQGERAATSRGLCGPCPAERRFVCARNRDPSREGERTRATEGRIRTVRTLELGWAPHASEYGAHFFAGEHDGQVLTALRSRELLYPGACTLKTEVYKNTKAQRACWWLDAPRPRSHTRELRNCSTASPPSSRGWRRW